MIAKQMPGLGMHIALGVLTTIFVLTLWALWYVNSPPSDTQLIGAMSEPCVADKVRYSLEVREKSLTRDDLQAFRGSCTKRDTDAKLTHQLQLVKG